MPIFDGRKTSFDDNRTNNMNEENISQGTLAHEWFVLRTLVSKDFKLKYRRSVLGVLWSLLNPLLVMIVLSAVFSYMFRFNIPNYPCYLILGNTIYALFSGTTSGSLRSIIDAAPLLKKVKIRKSLFPLERACFELVNFAISMIAAIGVMIYFRIQLDMSMLMFPVVVALMFVFSLGIGYLLAALDVFFRDCEHIWSVVLVIASYGTPLFYSPDILDPFMQSVMNLNPLYHYVTLFRDVTMWGIMPPMKELFICAACAIIMFGIGLFVFKKLENKFILYI